MQEVSNFFISGLNEIRYAVMEPLKLKLARARYERLYRNYDETPLVTVCVPTYNRGKLLIERAVKSVLAQTYSNLELLIIGDCCTDNTAELLSAIKDPRLRFYNLKERRYRYPPTAENHWLAGPVVAANKALELATGKWLARIDDDDTWTPDHIETLLAFAKSGDYEFVSAQFIEERHGKRNLQDGVHAQSSYYTRSSKPPKGGDPLIGGVSTWFYRSYLSFLKYNLNCWRKSWNRVNDVDLSLRIFNAGVRMGFLPTVLAYVLPRPGEATVGLDAYKLDADNKKKHFEFK